MDNLNQLKTHFDFSDFSLRTLEPLTYVFTVHTLQKKSQIYLHFVQLKYSFTLFPDNYFPRLLSQSFTFPSSPFSSSYLSFPLLLLFRFLLLPLLLLLLRLLLLSLRLYLFGSFPSFPVFFL